MHLIPTLSWAVDGEMREVLDARLLPLLAAIDATGSLAAAVTQRAISYRAAWGLLRHYEQAFGAPLVQLQRGRGAQLAPAGARLLRAQQSAEQRLARMRPSLAVDFDTAAANTGASPSGERARVATLVIAASHDLALAALRELKPSTTGFKLELSFMGSLHALQQFAEGRVDATGFHVALGARDAGDLTPFRRCLNARRDRLVRFVGRQQGLILPRGNPARVHNFRDIVRRQLRFVNRQTGSGTRLLIDRIVAEEGLRPEALAGYAQEEFTHPAIAATVASGGADVGFGLRAAAAERKLAFVPLVNERYYLAVRKAQLESAGVSALLLWLRSAAFARLAGGFAGYDPTQAGAVASVDTLGKA